MRCDSGQPGCLICAAYGDQCQYDKAPPVSQVVTMAKRLQQLEDVMNQLKHSDNDEVQRIVSKLDGTQPLNSKSISVAPSETASNPDLDGRASDSISVTRRDSIDSTVPSLMSELSMTSDGQVSDCDRFLYYRRTDTLQAAILRCDISCSSACSSATHAIVDESLRHGKRWRLPFSLSPERLSVKRLGGLCYG